jgi:hypothetical protein
MLPAGRNHGRVTQKMLSKKSRGNKNLESFPQKNQKKIMDVFHASLLQRIYPYLDKWMEK